MSLLSDLNTTLSNLHIPLSTGIFKDKAPAKYIVITPLSDSFALHANNAPGIDLQEARIALFEKENYNADKNAIVRTLLSEDYTITDRRYIGYETETGYHHYNVDVAKHYEMEE